MTENQLPRPGRSRRSRRLVLLASAAALSATVLLAGPGAYHSFAPFSWSTAAQAAEAEQPAGFGDLVARVKPAVISVRVKIDQSADENGGARDNFGVPRGSPMEKYFRQFGKGQPMPGHRRHFITGVGSGFFISADGYAVTNYHVVDHADSVQVTAADGSVFTAKVVGTDKKTDLALIKVDSPRQFAYVKFGDQPPRVGDWAVAVGNPFGLGGTVTAGIVSASGRDIGAGPYDDYIQIDAPINKGNSGGPTFNTNGEVIGVNTAIYSPSGGSVGIGFDIPAETAKMVVAQLKDKGVVTRGWIGVQVQPVTPGIAEGLGMKQAKGALVDEPQPDSPAAKAGIVAGDVVTAVDGDAVKDARDLARKIAQNAPGTSVKLDVLRKGDSKSLEVTIAKMPDEHAAAATRHADNMEHGEAYLGLQLAPAGEIDGAGSKGLVVTGVDPDGPAAERGIQTGDVILSVAGKPVEDSADVHGALNDAQARGKKAMLMKIRTADSVRFVSVPIG